MIQKFLSWIKNKFFISKNIIIFNKNLKQNMVSCKFVTLEEIQKAIWYPNKYSVEFTELPMAFTKQDGSCDNLLKRGDVIRFDKNKLLHCYRPEVATHIVLNCYQYSYNISIVELCNIITLESILIEFENVNSLN